MARRKSTTPTDLELEILQVLWHKGPSTATDVRKGLAPTRVLAATSVHTLMKIMLQKGYVKRKPRSRSEGGSLYSAVATRQNTAGKMINQILARFFGGSPRSLMQNLLTSGEVDAEDLEEMKDLLRKERRRSKR